MVLFSVAIARMRRLRASQSVRTGTSALALVVMMFTLAVLMCLLPYRIVWKSAMERLDVSGERCYRIGAQSDRWLIYCPDRSPLRNRVVNRNDEKVRDLGEVESIFAPAATSH
jgi:hypothetical protein